MAISLEIDALSVGAVQWIVFCLIYTPMIKVNDIEVDLKDKVGMRMTCSGIKMPYNQVNILRYYGGKTADYKPND